MAIIVGIGHAIVDIEYDVEESHLSSLELKRNDTAIASYGEQQQRRALLPEPVNLAPGGSLANSLATAAGLNASVQFICRVGTDATGDAYAEGLNDLKVRTQPGRSVDHETGNCLVINTEHKQQPERTMSTFLGASSQLCADDVELGFANVDEISWLIIEGYLLTDEATMAAAVVAIQKARQLGANICLTLAAQGLVSVFKDRYRAIIEEFHCDLVVGNIDELAAYTGVDSSGIDATTLSQLQITPSMLITDGANGAYFVQDNSAKHYSGLEADAVNVLGAGDCFLGAFLPAFIANDVDKAMNLAMHAGKFAVEHYGARLSTEQMQQLGDLY